MARNKQVYFTKSRRAYQVGKRLGAGQTGATFSATRRRKRYALKIAPRADGDGRELAFLRKVASKHPDMFTRMYDADQSHECDQVEAPCSRTVFERVDGVLDDILVSMTPNQVMSMLAQMCDVLSVLHRSGYIHGDVHADNIAFTRVPAATRIRGVPSHGYHFRLVDYGMVLHASDARRLGRAREHDVIMRDELMSVFFLIANRGQTVTADWDEAHLVFGERYPLEYVFAYNVCGGHPVCIEVLLINLYPSLIIPLLYKKPAQRVEAMTQRYAFIPTSLLVALMPFIANRTAVRDLFEAHMTPDHPRKRTPAFAV